MPRVLVIDDDASIRRAVGIVLSDEGFQVDEAPNGRAALEAIERCHPDVILLDMKMPIMDGWEFVRRYRARYDRRAPIVVVTAAPDAAIRGAEVGADGYLSKPFDLDALIARVAAVMRHDP
jgi:DNA-binding response OmpR family regulator